MTKIVFMSMIIAGVSLCFSLGQEGKENYYGTQNPLKITPYIFESEPIVQLPILENGSEMQKLLSELYVTPTRAFNSNYFTREQLLTSIGKKNNSDPEKHLHQSIAQQLKIYPLNPYQAPKQIASQYEVPLELLSKSQNHVLKQTDSQYQEPQQSSESQYQVPKPKSSQFDVSQQNSSKSQFLLRKQAPQFQAPQQQSSESQYQIPKQETPQLEIPKQHLSESQYQIPKQEIPQFEIPQQHLSESQYQIPKQETPQFEVPQQHSSEFQHQIPKQETPQFEIPQQPVSEYQYQIPKQETPQFEIPQQHLSESQYHIPNQETPQFEIPQQHSSEFQHQIPKQETPQFEIPQQHLSESQFQVPKQEELQYHVPQEQTSAPSQYQISKPTPESQFLVLKQVSQNSVSQQQQHKTPKDNNLQNQKELLKEDFQDLKHELLKQSLPQYYELQPQSFQHPLPQYSEPMQIPLYLDPQLDQLEQPVLQPIIRHHETEQHKFQPSNGVHFVKNSHNYGPESPTATFPTMVPRTELAQMGMPYEFEWGVKDLDSLNIFSHKESSDGTIMTGEYRVLLPDGRLQIVTFGDRGRGYEATVTYEEYNNSYL